MARLVLVSTALALAGCSLLDEKKIDYKTDGGSKLPSLVVPPDLIQPTAGTRYTVPGVVGRSSATASEYDRARSSTPASESSKALLPKVDKVRVERAGTQRWLVAQVPAKDAWLTVKDFWQELGFIINVEMPEAGVMETEWAENRAKIPQEGIRKFLGRAMDMAYSTGDRDKFRTRIEAGSEVGTVEIYISHRGMREIYEGTQSGGDEGRGRTLWQARDPDPELEAEMLRRLMVRLGTEEKIATARLAEKLAVPMATLTRPGDGSGNLILPEPFDRAWRRVGLALDRVGFVVEDRDRAGGIYFVRYADPEAGAVKKGFLDKVAFWRSDENKVLAKKYRVRVLTQGDTTTVMVLSEQGEPLRNETALRILTLLLEQLK